MSAFLITYGRGPNWRELSGPGEDPLPQHVAFAHQQHLHGMLLLAGALPEQRGALAVMEAEDEEAARELVSRDPAVVSGHFSLESIQPFRLIIGSPIDSEGGVS